ncbi:MAG: ASKHA domain-containing protein [Coriobacteriia bacterium]|nr:ASKHA domain-containing protein [Coriobacteriia bacterium]
MVPPGSLLLDVAREAGVGVDAPCGGIGRCGRCRVVVSGAVSPLTDDERMLLSAEDIAAGVRLACRARAVGDVRVSSAPPLGRIRIVEDAAVPRPEVEPPTVRGIVSDDPGDPLLGVAVDIGTTTLALALVDLRNGDEIAHASSLNPQHVFGADVMSRVTAALDGAAHDLQAAVVEEIESLALALVARVGAMPAHVREFSIVGNTAMRALLLAEDTTQLAAAPYGGAPVAPVATTAHDLGLRAFDAAVTVMPGVSAFIGGDTVAGLLVTHLAERRTSTLFMDLGTNGEIVLATGGRMLAASAAAGPALEGASIEMGMRAEPGAIERVRVFGDALLTDTIDGESARGICGSGLLDLIAAMLDVGALDASGRIDDGVREPWVSRVIERSDQRVFTVDEAAEVVLTQRDVRELQLAKGAIRTAIDMLLEAAGLVADDVYEVVVAGGFGLHVRGGALARIGMIPPEWAGRLHFVGNTALAGAVATLLGSEARTAAAAIAEDVETLDLAGDPVFQQRFIASLSFP